MVEPTRPDPGAAASQGRAKTDVADVDRDEDLRVANRVLFRSAHGSLAVQSARVATADDALRELVRCLFELEERPGGHTAFADHGIGFALDGRRGGATPQDGAFSGLATPKGTSPAATLCFYGQPYDAGFLRLLRQLGAVRRHHPPGDEILKRRGVTLLLW